MVSEVKLVLQIAVYSQVQLIMVQLHLRVLERTQETQLFLVHPNSTAAQVVALGRRIVDRARPATRSNPTLDGTTLTYKAGVYKYPSTQIYAPGTEIILDAENDPNAEFFIIADTQLVFRSVKSITLVNNASTCNVYWVAGTADIRFEGQELQKILILQLFQEFLMQVPP